MNTRIQPSPSDDRKLSLRYFTQAILAALIALHIASGVAKAEAFYSLLIDPTATSRSTEPLPFEPGQTVLATIWNQDDQAVPVKVSAIDAMSGETLGAVEAQVAPGVVSVMALPVAKASARYVLFQADGTPLRAKVQVSLRVFDGRLSGDSLKGAWARSFELEPTSKMTSAMTEPLVLTDAHQLTLQIFNQGGRAAVTVRGWDPNPKKEIIGKTKIVESGRGASVEIPSSLAAQLAPIVIGGTANGMLQLEVIVEPLDGLATITFTAEARSAYGNLTLKRGYVD